MTDWGFSDFVFLAPPNKSLVWGRNKTFVGSSFDFIFQVLGNARHCFPLVSEWADGFHLQCRRGKALLTLLPSVLKASKMARSWQDISSWVTKPVKVMAVRVRGTLSLAGSFLMLLPPSCDPHAVHIQINSDHTHFECQFPVSSSAAGAYSTCLRILTFSFELRHTNTFVFLRRMKVIFYSVVSCSIPSNHLSSISTYPARQDNKWCLSLWALLGWVLHWRLKDTLPLSKNRLPWMNPPNSCC